MSKNICKAMARAAAMLLSLSMLLPSAGFALHDDEVLQPPIAAEETPVDDLSAGEAAGGELPPPVTEDVQPPETEPTAAPQPEATETPETTPDETPAEPEAPEETETPAEPEATQTPEGQEAPPETMSIALLGGQVVGGAATAKMEPWDLYNAPAEVREAYDAMYRVKAAGVVSNRQWDYPGNTIDHILDDNENTFWEPYGGNEADFHLCLTFSFSQVETISRMVYGARLDAGYKGFPYEFAIYASLADSGEDFVLVARGGYEAAVGSLMEITFPETQFKRLRFEYVSAREDYPSCREMLFYRTDDSGALLEGLFTDYARLHVAEEYNSPDAIAALRALVENNAKYAAVYKPLIDRAEAVVNGELVFDPAFELSTDPSAQNVIHQTGDVVSYARNTLRFTSSSTNRQASGIAAYAGTTVTIYVDAPEGDPLPRIRFSQAYGYWASWLGGEMQLARGVNTFTVPNFKTGDYTTEVASGGAIYIVNPYTPSQQSDQVKIYIEGGDAYPVYRLGGDEAAYKQALTAYADRVRANPTGVIDLTELVSNHVIMTVTATRADEIYDTKSPEKNLRTWDAVIEQSMVFEGVQVDPSANHYNYMNQFLNVNYRVSQNWPGGYMFAASEHIGLYARGDGEDTLIYCLDDSGKPAIGWGHIHEYGHTVDLNGRVIGETTNNMVSNFLNTYFNGAIRNEDYIAIANAMACDEGLPESSFNLNRYNYMIFFLLESYRPGWWGDTNNLYRYEDHGYEGLNKTEKHVLLSSLAMGVDLGYYFERWGYNLSTDEPIFRRPTASETYKTLVVQAIADGRLKTTELPVWYLDSDQYMYMRNGGGGLYDESSTTSITRVLRTSGGYSLTLPVVGDSAHLGYEIWEGEGDQARIVGFTHGNSFTDTTEYAPGYDPVYRVAAYDRRLNRTRLSDPVSVSSAAEVCELNGVKYDTIAQALAAAKDKDEIIILKDIVEAGVTVDKRVTIRTELEAVTIEKGGNGPIFTVVSGGKLTVLSGGDNGFITLDGKGLAQSGALVEATGSGSITMTGVTLQNSVSRGNGGAVCLSNSSAGGEFKNVTFENNTAANGGAIYNVGTITVENCVFTGNTATSTGGAICNTNGGVIYLKGDAITGSSALRGGAIYGNGYTELRGGSLTDNSAKEGGAIYFAPGNSARKLSLDDGVTVENNTAGTGGFLYIISSGIADIGGAVIRSNPGGEVYDIFTRTGQITVDGAKADIRANIFKDGGKITVKTKMPPAGSLAFTLAAYTTAEPILVTDFALSESDIISVKIADGETYKLTVGENGESIYLAADRKVKLHVNDGQIRSGDLTGYIEGEYTVLPTDVVREGYTFLGWYETADFSGNSVKSIKATDTGDKEYYAKWVLTSYKITYQLNKGSLSEPAVVNYTYGDEPVTLPTHPTREGCKFLGWYDNAAFKGDAVSAIPAHSTGNKTFYAQWTCLAGPEQVEHETAASCTADGSYDLVTRCVDCGKELSRETETIPAAGHAFGDWIDVDGGGRKHICAVCGLEETEEDAWGGHRWDRSYTVDVAPTCETDGSRSIHCLDCQATRDAQVMSKTGHSPSHIFHLNETPATCTQGGSYDEVVCCMTCGTLLSAQTVQVEALEHDFGPWETIDGPDCDSYGARKRVCLVCGYAETTGVGGGDHEWEKEPTVDKAPTCTTEGSRSIHCAKCGAVRDVETIPALGHTPGETLVENETPAGCEGSGTRTLALYCEVCFSLMSRTRETVEAKGHTFGSWMTVKEPCGNGDVQVRVCAVCGYRETENMEADEHNWERVYTVDKAPTCTTEGSRSIHCADCGAVRDAQTISVLSHTPGDPVRENIVSPSCIEPGSYNEVTYCTRCGLCVSRWPVITVALGHDFGPWIDVDSPGCNDSDVSIRICRDCGFTETKDLDPEGHDWLDSYTVDKEPTCDSEGSQSVHCKNCDAVRDAVVIPELRHVKGESVRENVIAASCTKDGSYDEVTYCDRCGTLIIRVSALTQPAGHTFDDWESFDACGGEAKRRICTVCGYTETDGAADGGHDWAIAFTVDVEPTCETDGSQSIRCKKCGAVKESRILHALGHDLVTLEGTPGTCTTPGRTGDTVCTVCGKVIRPGVETRTIAHTFKNGKCTVCGATDPLYRAAEKPAESPVAAATVDGESPDTGDGTPLGAYLALFVLCALALAAMPALRRKREE